jgi:hypothetical protein
MDGEKKRKEKPARGNREHVRQKKIKMKGKKCEQA